MKFHFSITSFFSFLGLEFQTLRRKTEPKIIYTNNLVDKTCYDLKEKTYSFLQADTAHELYNTHDLTLHFLFSTAHKHFSQYKH